MLSETSMAITRLVSRSSIGMMVTPARGPARATNAARSAVAIRNGRSLEASASGLLRLVAAGELVAIGRGDGERIVSDTVLP